jgi:hypothetical protein
MNKRIRELMQQAGTDTSRKWMGIEHAEKFAELILRECAQLNQEQSYELAGVIVDTEEGDGFDHVCLNTVKRVHDYLATDRLAEHFGVES